MKLISSAVMLTCTEGSYSWCFAISHYNTSFKKKRK